MCNKLCTYRKYISVDSGQYDCSENPHIILSAREQGGTFSTFSPSGLAATNIYSTNFHKFYIEIYTSWVNQILVGQPITTSLIASPQFPQLTQTGSLVGDNPTLPVNNALQIVENYNTYNISSSSISGVIVNYSKPPFDFAENISANQFVGSFTYDQGDMNFSTGGDPILLVEFVDVLGKYCQYS